MHVISIPDALRIIMIIQPDERLSDSLQSFIEMIESAGRFGYTRNDQL